MNHQSFGPVLGSKGTFHHLIALFCTVAGKARHATGESSKFCNEIKDLEPDSQVKIRQNPLLIKHLDAGMQVLYEGKEPVGLGNRRLQIDRSGPFFTVFLPNSSAIGLQIRQKLASLGPTFACGAPSPTGSWDDAAPCLHRM